jgi:hypothetical protein
MKTFMMKFWYIGTILSVPPWGVIFHSWIGTIVQLIGLFWLILAVILIFKE